MERYIDISLKEISELLKANEKDRLSAEEIKRSRDEKLNNSTGDWRYDFFRDVNADMYIDGFVMDYPHGRVIRQAERSFHYRGENQLFSSSQSSLYRYLFGIKNKKEALVEEFVAFMRIADFLELLLKLDHTQKFLSMPLIFNNVDVGSGIDLLYEQLAQHYGLKTKWLDITSDFEVALFFACCKYNNKTHNWEPLNNSDFKVKSESQFGVIFQRIADHPNNLISSNSQIVKIYPVGFQPFMRCHMQSSYVALLKRSYSLQNDSSFKMFRFRHNEELCRFVYNSMDCGKKIYPHEGLNLFDPEIEDIKKRKVFSLETFEFAVKEPRFQSLPRKRVVKLLNEFGYKLSKNSYTISSEKIKKVNRLYLDFDIEQLYNVKLRTRMTYMPQK